MPTPLTQAIAEFRRAFENNGLDVPTVIRLKDADAGVHFLSLIEREMPLAYAGAKVRPSGGHCEIHGIRFFWPMRE